MSAFRDEVYTWVAEIPRGKVMTYGQLAALCGHPRAARQVGQIAKYGPEDLPWHRVVNRNGGLAGAFPYGGKAEHKNRLEAEGVPVSTDFRVNIQELLWFPQQKEQK